MPVLFPGHRAGATERRQASCLLSFSCMFRKTEGRARVSSVCKALPADALQDRGRCAQPSYAGAVQGAEDYGKRTGRGPASAPDEVRYSTFFSASVSGILFILTMSKNETIR